MMKEDLNLTLRRCGWIWGGIPTRGPPKDLKSTKDATVREFSVLGQQGKGRTSGNEPILDTA